jgi:hypothetical protein
MDEAVILHSIAQGFMEHWRHKHPQWLCRIADGRKGYVLEAERDQVVTRHWDWQFDTVWYNLWFVPDGVMLETPNGRAPGRPIPYHCPDLVERTEELVADYLAGRLYRMY